MKTKNTRDRLTVGALAALAFMLATPSTAHAAKSSSIMKACKKELKKHSCEAKTEEDAHQCLDKYEEEDKKHDGFSKGCYKANESYEKKKEQSEKTEPSESPESSEKHDD